MGIATGRGNVFIGMIAFGRLYGTGLSLNAALRPDINVAFASEFVQESNLCFMPVSSTLLLV